MDKITHEVRLENWKAVVEQCSARPKGMTIRVWLKEQGISEKTYYYWQRKVRQEAYDQMQQTSLPAVRRDAEVTFAEIAVLQEQEPDPPAHVLEGTTAFRPAAVIHTESCTMFGSGEISRSESLKISHFGSDKISQSRSD